jgi:hypothetical protein
MLITGMWLPSLSAMESCRLQRSSLPSMRTLRGISTNMLVVLAVGLLRREAELEFAGFFAVELGSSNSSGPLWPKKDHGRVDWTIDTFSWFSSVTLGS